VTRAHGGPDSSGTPSLSAEGRLRRAAGASRGVLFRDRRKRGEPQDRQRPENGRRVGEEQTVEVVRDHAGGTRMGTGVPIPKEDRAARRRALGPRGNAGRLRDADSPAGTMEGRSLDNPTRGNPAARSRARPGRKDRNAPGKSAPRSGGSCTANKFDRRADRSKGPRGRRRLTASNRRGGQRRTAREPRLRSDTFPPQEAPHGAGAWRGPRPGAVRGSAQWLVHSGARHAPGATSCSEGSPMKRIREPRGTSGKAG
jgi:hypothetical protein